MSTAAAAAEAGKGGELNLNSLSLTLCRWVRPSTVFEGPTADDGGDYGRGGGEV